MTMPSASAVQERDGAQGGAAMLHRPLVDLPVATAGVALEPGGVYLDLNNPAHGPFRALPGQVAGLGNRYVAERDVPCQEWRSLVQHAAGTTITNLEPCPEHPAAASHDPNGDATPMLAPLMSPL